MKKILLAVAGIGGLLAGAGGILGVSTVVAIGGGTMLIALLILPWLPESPPPANGR
jgi:hypothetical protein